MAVEIWSMRHKRVRKLTVNTLAIAMLSCKHTHEYLVLANTDDYRNAIVLLHWSEARSGRKLKLKYGISSRRSWRLFNQELWRWFLKSSRS